MFKFNGITGQLDLVEFDEAPIDGNTYGRNDAGWVEITSSVQYWQRAGTTLSPLTAGDNISTTGIGIFGETVAPVYEQTTFFYTSVYPSTQDTNHVKATSNLDLVNYAPWFATNHANSVTGGPVGNQWYSGGGNYTNQRFHIDLDANGPAVVKRIYIENSHQSGASLIYGAKDFTLWGSNSSTSFNDLTYSHDTGWTQLTISPSIIVQHFPKDASYPQYFIVTNTTAYRYYAIKFADNYANSGYISVRRIELQTQGSAGNTEVIDNANHLLTDQNGNTVVNFYAPGFLKYGNTFLQTPGIYGDTAANGSIIIDGTTDPVHTSSVAYIQPNGGNVILGGSTVGYVQVGVSHGDNSGYLGLTSAVLNLDGIGYGSHFGVSGSGTAWIQSATSNATTKYDLALQPNGGNVSIGLSPITATSARLDVKSTTEQLRLRYDDMHETSFIVDSTGGLTIDGNIKEVTMGNSAVVGYTIVNNIVTGYVQEWYSSSASPNGTTAGIFIDNSDQFGFNTNANPIYFGNFSSPSSDLAGFSIPGLVAMSISSITGYVGIATGFSQPAYPLEVGDYAQFDNGVGVIGNISSSGNLIISGIDTGSGPPGTIYSSNRLYVDLLTGIVYLQ